MFKFITSWDDGHILDKKIVELNKKYKIPGIFYITIDYVGRKDYLTWDDIKEIDAEENQEIGCHTINHPADMKLLFNDQIIAETGGAKGILESVLGHKVNKFCYPRGRYNENVIYALKDSGFLEARTTKVGCLTKSSDPFRQDTTVHVYSGRSEYEGRDWFSYANLKLDEAFNLNKEGKDVYYHLWGHSWEIDRDKEWDKLEEFYKLISVYIKDANNKE